MTVSATLVQVPGLSAEHQDALTGLLLQLAAKASRNRLRRRYYEHKTVLRDLGIAIPPQSFIELQSGQKILNCPNCQRLIYWCEHFEDKTEENAAPANEPTSAVA